MLDQVLEFAVFAASFRIFPRGQQWGWQTLDAEGSVTTQGVAPSKAIAAACVIRETVAATVGSGIALRRAA